MLTKSKPNLIISLLIAFTVVFLSTQPPVASAQMTQATAGSTIRISVTSGGIEGNGTSYDSSISTDGRYVAFSSVANNLISGDTNGKQDIFVYDRQIGQTTRVSVASNGIQSNGHSGSFNISSNGRYIAFDSDASNLVSGDTNGFWDVFVYDRQTSQTIRVSVSSNGTQANHDSGYPAISADGRYIVFASRAGNLVIGDTNDRFDIFIHDRQTGQTSRVSGNGPSFRPDISADGRYIVFDSAASLVSEDTNNEYDVYVYDHQTGHTSLVSVDSSGLQANGGSGRASISADGHYIAFSSSASNLVDGDTNGVSDTFVHDQQTGKTTRVSISSDQIQGNLDSFSPAISENGRYITFYSLADNLVTTEK